MCRAASFAVFCNGQTLKRTFDYFATVPDMCGKYRAIQIFSQPFLALTFSVDVLKACNQATKQV